MSAGWLGNYLNTIQKLNTFENRNVNDCHTLLSKNIHRNIFSLKLAKNKNIQPVPEKNILIEKECKLG